MTRFLPKRFLTREEVAEYLGVSPHTIDRWARERKLTRLHPPGGRTARFDISEVDAFLRKASDHDRA